MKRVILVSFENGFRRNAAQTNDNTSKFVTSQYYTPGMRSVQKTFKKESKHSVSFYPLITYLFPPNKCESSLERLYFKIPTN